MDRYGSTYSDSDEHRPVLWLRGYPVYAAHFIVLVFVASMIANTIFSFLPAGMQFFRWFPFNREAILHGQVWRILTHGLVIEPSVFFVIQMLMFARFGMDTERYLGRSSFLWLFAGVYLLPPLLFLALGGWISLMTVGDTGAFAMFVAFATIYPGALLLFNVLAKWAAIVLVGIFTLIALNSRNLGALISLWATCGFAYAYVRHHQGHFELPKLSLWRPKPKLRVVPDLPAKSTKPAAPARTTTSSASMAEVDALLDKIASSGFASLTAAERAKLDSARAEMLKRGAGRG
jgi:hypothetical protein